MMNRPFWIVLTIGAVALAGPMIDRLDARTIVVRVEHGDDDAEEHLDDNRIDIGSSDLELGEEGSGDFQLVGIRFMNLDLAPGETIIDARLQFTVDEGDTDSGPTSVTVQGELAADAARFGEAPGDISGRSRTSASVAWDNIPSWDMPPLGDPADGNVTDKQRTPNLAAVVQEIVNQPGWAAGNAMVFLIEGTGERTAASFNGEQNGAPILIVTTTGGPHEKVLFRRITHPDDDVEQDNFSGGGIDIGSSDLEISAEGGTTEQIIGVRWVDVTIPPGSTITSAHVQFQHDENDSGPDSVEISGQKVPNAPRFSTTTDDVFNRTLTDAFVEWLNIPPWVIDEEAGPAQRTPDLSAIVQEIIDQPDWQAGNALVVLIEQGSQSGGERTAESWNGDADASALLVVRYVPPTGFGPDPVYAADVDDSVRADFAFSEACNANGDVTYTVTTGDAGVADVSGSGDVSFVADGPPFGSTELQINGAGTTTVTATPQAGSPAGCTALNGTVEVVAAQSLDLLVTSMILGTTQQALVIGDYGPAGQRDVTAGATGTVYTTNVAGVIDINADGLIDSLNVGDVEITATNGAASTTVAITVTSPVALTVRSIIDGNDDAEEQAGRMYIGSSDLELGDGDSNIIEGMRFLDIDVPRGATIISATIQFQADEVSTSAADLRVFAALLANAGPILPLPYRFSLLPHTSSVDWRNVPPWPIVGERGPGQQTPNFAAIIQEIVDLPGWRAGNNMLILIDGNGTRTAEAFSGGEAELTIQWTLPEGFSPQPLVAATIDPVLDVFLKTGDLCNVGRDAAYTITSDDASVVAPASQDLTFADRALPFQMVSVTPVAAGSTTLTATPADGLPGDCTTSTAEVQVVGIDSLTLSVPFAAMEPGDSQQATVTGLYGQAGDRSIESASTGTTYTVDPPGVISVGPDGAVTADALGTVTLTATNNGATDSATITVAERVTRIAFLVGETDLDGGDLAARDYLVSLTFSGDPGQLDPNGLAAQVVPIHDEDFNEDDIEARYDLLVISSTIEAFRVAGKLRCKNIPVILWDSELVQADRLGLAGGGRTRDTDNLTICPQGIFVTDGGHPITNGLPLDPTCHDVFISGQTQSVAFTGPESAGALAGGARVLAESEFLDNATIIVAGPAGDPDLPGTDGTRLGAEGVFLSRHVFLWLEDDTFGSLNDNGRLVVDRAIDWALAGVRGALLPTSIRVTASRTEICPPGLTAGGAGEAQLRVVGVAQASCPVALTDPSTGTTYASSDTGVATVDAFGVVRSVGEGVTTVTATNGDLSATIDLTVTPEARQPGFIIETWGPNVATDVSLAQNVEWAENNPPNGTTDSLTVNFIDFVSDPATESGDVVFPGGDPNFPFLPPPGDNNDFIMRATGFLQFDTTDTVTLRIHSDDGFRLIIDGIVADLLDGGRAPAASTFAFTPPRTGIVPMELVFWEEGGDAEVEFTQIIDGVAVLVNDPDDPRSIRAFQSVPCQPDDVGPAPVFASIMGGLGSAVDSFISPLGEDVPFTEFGLATDIPLDSITVVGSAYTAGGTAPTVASFVSNGDGTHVVTLDSAITPGNWLRLDLELAGAGTASAAVSVWLAHQPLDVNQDGQTNIRDATAFGDVFRGSGEPRLININGDGSVNVRDATAFGNNWNGVAPLQAWRNTQLPAQP